MSRKSTLSEQREPICHRPSLQSVAASVNELLEESRKHDKYHNYSAKIQYIFILVMSVLYLVYGMTRYIQCTQHHRVNTYIVNTDTSYPIPVTMVCQDASGNKNNNNFNMNSYVNITQLVVDQIAMSINPKYFNPDIQFIDNPTEILNLSHWNAVQFYRNETFAYYWKNHSIEFNVTVLFQCQVILPPNGKSFKFGYLQNYLYHKPGLGEIDPTLASFQNENIQIPQYMSKQFGYKIIHRIFHFDALFNSIKNRYPTASTDNLTLSQVTLAAFSYGTTIYAAPWSVTNFVLSLITHKYLKNNLFLLKYNNIDSFDVNTVSSLSEIYIPDNISPPKVSQDSSIISFNHFPHQQNEKLTTNCNETTYNQCSVIPNFYHQYDEEYLDYTFWDLLSGLGGIVTGSYSFSAMIIKLLLYGFSCCNGKYRFRGFAPYPSMDRASRVQLHRFNKIETSKSDLVQ